MATPVPYQGAPDITPRMEPTPSVGISTPPAAFGVNVAEAASHLGQVEENSGKELFDRAYAMQELQVHADVNARLSDSTNKMMNLEADYHNTEGKNAVDGLPGFQQNLEKIRSDGGQGLSPVGQEYYDTESRNWRNRIGWSGVTHAKDEQKRYIMGTSDALISTAQKSVQLNPNDPKAVEAQLQTVRDQVNHKFDILKVAPDDPQRLKAVSDAINKTVQGQIKGMAQSDAIGAQKLYNDAVAKKEIYGDEASSLGQYIKWQRDLHGSRVTAGNVLRGFNGGGPLLHALIQNESGGRNVTQGNIGDINNLTGDLAQGYFQITTGTWRDFAPQAGVDLAKYPNAKLDAQGNAVPYNIQAQVASVIPLRKWGSATIAAMRATGKNIDISKTLGQNLAMNGEGFSSQNMPLQQIVDYGRRAANEQFPGDGDFADATEQQITTKYRTEEALRRDTDFNNEQTIASAIIGGVGPGNKLPTTVDELKLDPKAAQAWDDLQAQTPTKLRSMMNMLAANAKGNVALTPERLNEWQKLSGMAVTDPDKFMQATQDLSQIDLPIDLKKQIIHMQQLIYKKQDASPQLSHALAFLNQLGVMQAAGLTKDNDPDNLHLFTGVLEGVMSTYQQQNGKPMDDDTIKSTAQQLLNNVPGRHLWNSSRPWFESIDEVPPEAAKAISDSLNQAGIMPSDQEIMTRYLARQYQEVYGKKQSAGGGGYQPQRFPQSAPNIKSFQ